MNSVLAERPASDFMDDQFVQICVKFRLFINTLEEQFWFFHTPGFECINRRKMAESALRDVVVVGQQVVVQSGLQLGA